MTIRVEPPDRKTLQKHGLTLKDWQRILTRQKFVCPLCGTVPKCTRPTCKKPQPHGHFVIEHHHVPGWKKMKPEQRKQHVRGLMCPWDNRFVLGRYITIEKSKRITTYLNAHERRKRR